MSRAMCLVALTALLGCRGLPDPCDGFDDRTCIALEIQQDDNGPSIASVDALEVTPLAGLTFTGGAQKRYLTVEATYPLLIAIVPATLTSASVELRVDAYAKASGERIGTGVATLMVREGQHVRVPSRLGSPFGFTGDMASHADLAGRDQSGGGIAIGSTCTPGVSQCVSGASCFWYQDAAICRKSCMTDGDCPATATPTTTNTAHCTAIENGKTTPDACTMPCNPVPALGGSSCPTGTMCYVYQIPNVATESTNCADEGTLPEGSTCTSTLQCTDGHTCVGQTGNLHCRKVCRKSTDADCTGGYVCRSINGRTVFGACCASAGC